MLRFPLVLFAISSLLFCCNAGILDNFDWESLLSIDGSASGDGSPPVVASQSYTKCPGKGIESYVIKTYKVRSLLACVRDCMVHMHCRSAVVCREGNVQDKNSTFEEATENNSVANETAESNATRDDASQTSDTTGDVTQANAPSFDASQLEMDPGDVISGSAKLQCTLSAFSYTKCSALPDTRSTCSALIMKHWCKNGGKPGKYKWRCECPTGFEGTFCQKISTVS